MTMKRLFGSVAVFISLASALAGLSSIPAHAQATNTVAAQGLQVSPTTVELNGDPGKTYAINLKVFNVTESQLAYTSSVDDFKAKDETGTPSISVDTALPTTASVRTWINEVPRFILSSHETENVTANVTIPSNAEPGGHYGVIQFSGVAPDVKDTGVGLSAGAGVLVLIRVSGDITEKATLASFSTTQKEKQHFLFEKGPITFTTRIRNEGDVHIAPHGTIELHNMFGGLVTTMKVNEDGSNVLPSSIRRFESNYDKSWMFGRYTADLTLGYGTKGEAITGQLAFWVIPYKLVLILLLVLVTAIFILVRLIRVYNRHIIEKARNEKSTKSKNRKKS